MKGLNFGLMTTAVMFFAAGGCERKSTAEKVVEAQREAQRDMIEAQKKAEVAKIEAQAKADREIIEAQQRAQKEIGAAAGRPGTGVSPPTVIRTESPTDGTAGKVEEKIKDALNVRPNEKTKDALEDAADRAREAADAAAAKAEEAARKAENAEKKAGR
jgi:hypothetical protein